MIEKAAEIAYQMASNKDFEKNTSVNNGETDVPALFLEPIAVDKNNMRNTIIADGFFTESQVYN
jgi:ABC-type xylose transport system substrate-binding protein